MSLFKNKDGGFSDVIRCDQDDYLIWKWTPSGEANTTKRENAIRYGSSLRVKDGELAVFVYEKDNGQLYDFISGPTDLTLKTANLPVLSSIIGLAYAGNSPFQAEVYFINLAGNIQMKFGVPFFDIFDLRFPDLAIPCSVRGHLIFNLTDYGAFINLNRLRNFDIEDFKSQVKDTIIRKTKKNVLDILSTSNISVIQIESKIDEISGKIQDSIANIVSEDFGINIKRFDISAIDIKKESENYLQLKKITIDQQTKIIEAKTNVDIENLDETMRINRKNIELGVEGQNIQAHQINKQSEVLKTAAESLGQMGSGEGGSSLDMGSMMASMTMGGAIGSGMAGMMGNMIHNSNQNTPPPLNNFMYHVSINGQPSGPFNFQQLQQLVQNGQLTSLTYVWKNGMLNWDYAQNIAELNFLFPPTPPPLP